MRFYCSGTALSPSDGPYTLAVTAVSSSATPTHWAGTALGSCCHRVSGSGTRVNWSCTAVNSFAIAVSSFGAGENCFRTNENSLGTTRHLRAQAPSCNGSPSQCARNVSNWPDASACARGLRTVREGPCAILRMDSLRQEHRRGLLRCPTSPSRQVEGWEAVCEVSGSQLSIYANCKTDASSQ
jgi:hypothetical protein